ncbi:MAG: (Fe-S)-binding protein [Elusimicrobiota bacterium]
MKNYRNDLYTHNRHLVQLITKNGTKNIYDAVSSCTRCGYCLEVCPTYLVGKKETLSPRARNQIVRMLIEGKYKDVNTATYSIDTCLLCGACSKICYGNVATADIVLEARREEKKFGKSFFYKAILFLRMRKKIFDFILKILYLFHNLKLSYIADKLGIFTFLGYPSISTAIKKTQKLPKKFFHSSIDDLIGNCEKPKWIYFLTCGTDYLFPEVGKSTIKTLKKLYGDGIFMNNECCGLISYNYGSIEDAKKLAIKNIEIYEKIKTENPNTFIVADCSSCVAFMKSYPQMFSEELEKDLYLKAKEFSSKVKDIVEVIKPEYINKPDTEQIKGKIVTIHHSCKAYNDQGLKDNQEMVLKPILKENLVNLNESNICCGGAGAYAFTKPEFSNLILKRKVSNIAKTHADIVLVSSTSCLMQIRYGVSKYYPHTKVMHYIELIDKII